MSCLAGVAGNVKPLMTKALKATRIVAIDGCPLNCARHALLKAGFADIQHIELHRFGHRKGACPVNEERVSNAAAAASEVIQNQERLAGCA